MSVIGPRPQLVRDMVFMTDEQRKRHTAKPGLSGLAQTRGRNALSWDAKLATPISWITDGQKVPRFIEKATAVYFLTRLNDFEIDRNHIDEKFNQQETKKF